MEKENKYAKLSTPEEVELNKEEMFADCEPRFKITQEEE